MKPLRLSLAEVAAVFSRAATFAFGGGTVILAEIQREAVEKRRWLTRSDFGFCYALARVTPGTNIFAFCTACGWRMAGWRGATSLLIAASLPAVLITSLATAAFDWISANQMVRAGIDGALAASVGILLAGTWSLAKPQLLARAPYRAAFILTVSFGLSVFAAVPAVVVLALAAAVGFAWPPSAPEPE